MAKPKKKSRSVSVSFKGVDASRRQTLPEDQYPVRVAEAEMDESSTGNDMLKVTYEVTEGEHEGAKLYDNFSFSKGALWKLAQMLIAAGYEDVEDEDLDLDLDELIDSELTVEVAHEKYEGKNRAKVIDYIPSEGEEEEPEPEPKKKSKGKAKEEVEEEEEEKPAKGKKKKSAEVEPVTVEAVNEMDEDELTELIENASLDVDLDDFPTLRKARTAVIDALEEKDLIAAEEEEEAPKKKKRK